ncbi:hypothetical protein ACROYT_G006467 [Oculina patagonica]
MNSTSPTRGNFSLPCQLASLNTASKLALTAVYAVVFIVALFGNCAIILIAKTKRRIRKVAFNLFIISMATADIMDALFAVPLTVLYFYIGDLWFEGLFGDITCKLFNFFNILSLAASVFTLAAIAVDRYLAIVHVLREPLSKRKVKLAVVSVWLFASLLMSTYLIKYRSRKLEIDGKHHCFGVWDFDDLENNLRMYQYEVATRFILMYVIPLFLMAFLYSLIIRVLKKRQAFGENMSQIRIQRQNVTVIKMLVTVVLLFAFCWIPTHVVSMMVAFSYEKILCWPMSLTLTLIVPSHANGAINPCIYLIFNENFRKGLKDLIVRCRRKAGDRIPTKKIKQWPGSSTLERDPSRGGIKGYFRHLSGREKTSDTDDVYDTRL